MHEDATCNDLQKIITQAINEIKQEQGENFNLAKINLAELERRTGLSRSRLRHLKENNFIVTPHGRTGQKATATILTGYSGIIDGLLRKGVTNSSVCFERLQEAGYTGGLTTVKTYIADHRDFGGFEGSEIWGFQQRRIARKNASLLVQSPIGGV